MGLEIERRFLFKSMDVPNVSRGIHLKQAYLSLSPEVRIRSSIGQSTITVKTGVGVVRGEWEYQIPDSDAVDLMRLTPWSIVEKIRTVTEIAGTEWILDMYLSDNAGLYVAEIELSSPEQELVLPSWIEMEVTDDPRYNASYLARFPYAEWQQ